MVSSLLQQILSGARDLIVYWLQWMQANPGTASMKFSGVIRWILPVLAFLILCDLFRSMLQVKNKAETWGHLFAEPNLRFPIQHWENTIGRAKHCDIVMNLPTVSRTQCAISRSERGEWRVYHLSGNTETFLNGVSVTGSAPLRSGDFLSFGGVQLLFLPLHADEINALQQRRREMAVSGSPWRSLLLLTLFQVLTAAEMMLSRTEYAGKIGLCYLFLAILMWSYILLSRIWRRNGFEVELPAFFACTISMAVVASSGPDLIIKQTVAIFIGFLFFLALGFYLRDLDRAMRIRYPMAVAALILLSLSLLFGSVNFGAKNWITVAGLSIQPSELAKVCFIFAGSATLDRLFARHNIWGFILLSGACMGLLALMNDFGSAAIFFVVFLVISYLRSGDWTTLSLISAGAVAVIGLVLRFKPYVAARFATWGHAWEYMHSGGYQQARAMSAAASGGLIGVGPGNGWLHHIAAGDTDLVFAMVCEEWGLLIALLLVANIICLAVFSVRMTRNGRSSFYTIAACAAGALLVFQTTLNVLGSVDLLPLTGVTFPFVSNGGTSMVASWGLLAFLKAADNRQGASFAVRSGAKETPPPSGGSRLELELPEIDASFANELSRLHQGEEGEDA